MKLTHWFIVVAQIMPHGNSVVCALLIKAHVPQCVYVPRLRLVKSHHEVLRYIIHFATTPSRDFVYSYMICKRKQTTSHFTIGKVLLIGIPESKLQH